MAQLVHSRLEALVHRLTLLRLQIKVQEIVYWLVANVLIINNINVMSLN